jgi:predicted dithiol-disulfide oxidoreductase (DUF899 family)
MSTTTATKHNVVSPAAWATARKQLLAAEKDFAHRRDELARQRRALPWVKVDKNYVFDTPAGKKSLADLFVGRDQLIVYHFMLGPDWTEGCPGCSFVSDHFDGSLPHLAARGVSFVAISRAPLANIEAFKQRMGWRFLWVSSAGNDFNFDFHVSFKQEDVESGKAEYNYGTTEVNHDEMPGLSVFYRDADGTVFHTYSTFARGLDPLIGAYQLLDLVPDGRDEDDLDPPMAWIRHHDRYADTRPVELQARFNQAADAGSCCQSEKVKA